MRNLTCWQCHNAGPPTLGDRRRRVFFSSRGNGSLSFSLSLFLLFLFLRFPSFRLSSSSSIIYVVRFSRCFRRYARQHCVIGAAAACLRKSLSTRNRKSRSVCSMGFIRGKANVYFALLPSFSLSLCFLLILFRTLLSSDFLYLFPFLKFGFI